MTAGPLATAPNPSNEYIGRGHVYIKPLTLVNGIYTGDAEFDLGNSTVFALTPKVTTKEKYESLDAQSNLYARAVTQQTHSVKITGDEMALRNLAAATNGTVATVAQAATAVTGETLTTSSQLGAWYKCVNRQIGTVTVHQGGSALVVNTDYLIDAKTGRIYTQPTSVTITPGSTLTVDYTPTAYTYNVVQGAQQSAIHAGIRFIGAELSGPEFQAEVYHVMFVPSSDLNFISDDFAAFTLDGMIIKDTTLSPAYANGAPYVIFQTA